MDSVGFKQRFSHAECEYILRQYLGDYAIYDILTQDGKNNGLVLLKQPINLLSKNLNKTWWLETDYKNAVRKFKELTEDKTNEAPQIMDWNFNNKIFNIESNARKILDDNPLYFDDNKRWWKWLDNRWAEVKEHQILNFIKQMYMAQGLSHSTNRTSLLNALKDETASRKPISPEITWLQMNNTIFDIKNDDIIFPDPKYFIKNVIPHSIGTNTDTPNIDKLFIDWVGEERKQVLYDICAYAISPTLFLDLIVFLIGRGSNGKGIFTRILNKLVGEENTASKSIELLSDLKGRFQTNCLIDKYLLNLGDGNFSEIKDTKVLKELAGGQDKIPAEIKGGGHLEFYNKALPLGSFNTLPVCRDKTEGWYRRLLIVEFNNQFEPKEVFNTIPEHEFENLAYKSLQRLKEIYKARKITGKFSTKETKIKYEQLSNPISIFVQKNMQDDIKGAVSPTKLYNEYKKFAVSNGFNEFTYQDFIVRFESIGLYDKKRMDVYYEEQTKYCYRDYDLIPSDFCIERGTKNKLFVYTGLVFINQPIKKDRKDRKDRGKGIDFPYEKNQVERGVFSVFFVFSENLKNDANHLFDYICHNPVNNSCFIDENFDTNLVKDLLRKGDLFENPKGTYKILE